MRHHKQLLWLSPPRDLCPHVESSSQISTPSVAVWKRDSWNTALPSSHISTNGDQLIKHIVWHLNTLLYFKISVWGGFVTPVLISVTVFELRTQVWKFWPKYTYYYQVTAFHSQRRSVKISSQCNSSYCICPTGTENPLVSCLLIGCFRQCSIQSKGGKKKLTELHRNIAFFPRVEAKQTEV